MSQQSWDRLDRSNQIATGSTESDEQRCQVHQGRDDRSIRAAPQESGGGLDRDSGPGFRNRYRSVGYRATVPEFRSGKSYYFQQIWRHWSWLGVESKIMRTFGGWHLGHERAWPRIVLYDPGACMDERTTKRQRKPLRRDP